MTEHRIFGTKFSSAYPLYVQKAERKNHTQDELAKGKSLDKILRQ